MTRQKPRQLVLDTHIWIWLLTGDPHISKETQQLIHHVATEEEGLLLPAICIWEIAMLEVKKRIRFNQPIKEWVLQALSLPGLQLAPLTPEIALESCNLPGEFHGDPADRMIVATARLAGATLLTKDQRLLDYGQQGQVAVLSG